MNPADWGFESLSITKSFVYNGLEEGGWPSDNYMTIATKIAEERLAYGGYRLADVIINAWANNEELEKVME